MLQGRSLYVRQRSTANPTATLHYRRIGRRHAVNVNQATWRTGMPLCQATRVLPNAMALVGNQATAGNYLYEGKPHRTDWAKAAVATVERRDHWNTDHAKKWIETNPAAAHCSAQ